MVFRSSLFCALVLTCFSLWSSSTQALVVLQYHHISTKSPPSTSTSPDLFKAHLAFLAEQQFEVISIEALPKILQSGKLPDKAVIITFDDGYKSIFETAWPELHKRKWPFTVFVNSKPHDEKNPLYMSWEELGELSKHGVTVANHTDSHAHLIRRRAGESREAFQERRLQELLFAEKRLKKVLGKAPKYFAYPYGEYDSNLMDMLATEGYLAFGQQSGPVAAYTHPQLIPRFPMGGVYGSMDDFATKIYSLPFVKLNTVVHDSQGRVLQDPELPAGETMPQLELISPLFRYANIVQCFASGQGAIAVKAKGGSVLAKAPRSLPVGRSRYNCTAHAGGPRYYWFSQMFIRRNSDGSWYRE